MRARTLILWCLVAALPGATACAGCERDAGVECTHSGDCAADQTCMDNLCVSLGGDDGGNWWENDGGTDGGTDGGATDGGGGDGGGNNGELCGNGFDDNGDGVIDEGCPCTVGAAQTCWPGTAERRGKGACRDGAQVCQTFGDLDAWGTCEGAVLPATEVAGNGIDEDCDGADGLVVCTGEVEICANGADDECDGLTDCQDPDCRTSCSVCDATESGCNDGDDSDCDGLRDCDDPDCILDLTCLNGGCTPQFFVEIDPFTCGDGVDNDCDGKTDCGDQDCKNPGSCGCTQYEAACGDNEDNDCDGHTDCADAECEACAPGATRWCDEPSQCHWGTQECDANGRWGTCYETNSAPSGCDPDGLYSLDCCLAAGQCCENYPTDQQSRGNCTGVVTQACQ
ncbi:MAG: hypothetical protein P1V51_09355 [Deltaproteobacteria bacterium]|nr:hypothetical protein [Deltaproteobacteria bacterium]